MAKDSRPGFFVLANGEILNVSEIRRVMPLRYIGRNRYAEVYLKGDKDGQASAEFSEREYNAYINFLKDNRDAGHMSVAIVEKEPTNA